MSEHDWECKKTKFAADQQRILELRELNAELLDAVRDISRYHYCLPQSFVDKANAAIAKAKELGY